MAEDINITYKIEEDELICLESNDTDGEYIRWNNQKNMRYSISDMPFNINYARLDEEFSVIGENVEYESTSFPRKVKISHKSSNNTDNRIKNIVYYSWDKTYIDSSTIIETDLDGIPVKDVKLNGASVRYGTDNKGCLFAAKSNLDKGYLTPLMTVNGLMTIIKDGSTYRCYLLQSNDDTYSHWIELVVNKTVYFYCNMPGWSDNGTCYDTSKPDGKALREDNTYYYTLPSEYCEKYYKSCYQTDDDGNGSNVQKAPPTGLDVS